MDQQPLTGEASKDSFTNKYQKNPSATLDPPMQHYPLVLDTDIGDDIDDALALSLVLNSPEIELRGITTVFRDAPRRTLLVKQLLGLMNAPDIPVAAGASRPLIQPWSAIPHGGSQLGKQFEALDTSALPEGGPHAIEFLAKQIHLAASQDQRLTIAVIGPLTNIALLFSVYPDVVSLCDLLIMGGKWSEASPEWNIECDPEAAAIVFSSGANITMVGLDVTLQCVLSDAQVADFSTANKRHTHFLADLIALWAHPITLHDPLTLLVLFDECVRFEPKRIEVGLCGEARGLTITTGGEANCRVAVSVDAERAKSVFMERVLA